VKFGFREHIAAQRQHFSFRPAGEIGRI